MLLDRELDNKQRNKIIGIIKNFNKIEGAHDLRTRRSGSQIKMALDIELAPNMPLREAHQIAIELEHLILEEFPDSEIMIHIDPYGEPEDMRHTQLEERHVIPLEGSAS
jgi:ferrous-iron efflux pump FieF